MGFLDRMFKHKPKEQPGVPPTGKDIPLERVGLNGEFDQSGLAKRVAQAFDAHPALSDSGEVWIAQHNTTVVLKGKAKSQQELDIMVDIAAAMPGASEVDSSQIQIG